MRQPAHPVRRFLLPTLLAALLAGALAPTAALAQHRGGGWGGHGGWYGGYRGGGWGYVGVLPALATVLTIGAITYWLADGQYYRAVPNGGYVVVAPPAEVAQAAVPAAAAKGGDKLFVYPRQAQSADKQAADEYDCHKWAVAQTGFDPVAASSGTAVSADQRSSYQRAQSACLEARGYTVR
jgi:hypothetical protein